MKRIITPIVIILALLNACREETACDIAGYALPEIRLIVHLEVTEAHL